MLLPEGLWTSNSYEELHKNVTSQVAPRIPIERQIADNAIRRLLRRQRLASFHPFSRLKFLLTHGLGMASSFCKRK
ncbi:hypothetical protein J7T55_003260 [Diaporthe amygdali]|uniref:uncharacterized protein n=1 Tax=Phomopsis amygdali TaxID=1214568 RepID=UPI0022FEBC9D|nr:uncharacterized protein J7T55_003260 [Diaporthe amygdali]KAJ0122744.1 hypothetical protein J7T55_003260 [Diaporthe amygdali]